MRECNYVYVSGNEGRYEHVFCFYLLFSYVIRIFNNLFRNYVGNFGMADSVFLAGVLAVLIVSQLRTIRRRLELGRVLLMLVVLVVLFLSSLASPDCTVNHIVMYEVVVKCVPMFLLASCVRDFGKLYDDLVVSMRVIPYFLFLISFVLKLIHIDDSKDYSQAETYVFLLPAVVLLVDLVGSFRLMSFVPLCVCVVSILIGGARGPLVSLLLTLPVAVFFRSRSQRKGLVVLMVVVAAFVVVYNLEVILYAISSVLDAFGFSSRTVRMLMATTLMEDEARTDLAGICFEYSLEHPLVGTGPVNERFYLVHFLHSEVIGAYPHNFITELLIQYGLVVGLALCVGFVALMYKVFRLSVEGEFVSLILVLCGAYFFPLLFSGSYIQSPGFYAFMAICITIVRCGDVFVVRSLDN